MHTLFDMLLRAKRYKLMRMFLWIETENEYIQLRISRGAIYMHHFAYDFRLNIREREKERKKERERER